jgi:diaminopimelate dehydrogenase
MERYRVAIVGYGKLGRACAQAIKDCPELELAGIVRRGEHIRDLRAVDVALVCVPGELTRAVATELLEQRFAVVECAALDGKALEEHHAELFHLAERYRMRAMVAAGWDPGVLGILQRTFETLIPHGASEMTPRPAVGLHHIAEKLPGVRAALAAERHAGGERQRYVYVELAPGARLEAVQAAIAADPAFAGERTEVFAVDSVAGMEAYGHGVLLERRGTGGHGEHPALVFEGRFDPTLFAARVMLDAARRLPQLGLGGHRYSLEFTSARSSSSRPR